MRPVADFLSVLPTHVQPALVSPSVLASWQSRAGGMPATSHVLLECHLNDYAGQADLHLSINRGAVGHQALLTTHPPSSTGQKEDLHIRFAHHWAGNSLPAYAAIPHIWLSYVTGEPSPRLYLRSDKVSRPALTELLYSLAAPGRVAQWQQLLVRVGCQPTYVGLLPRGEQVNFRLIWFIPPAAVSSVLKETAWLGDPRPLNGWLPLMTSLAPVVGLVVDMVDTLLPQLGLEFMHDTGPDKYARWDVALARLVGAGLCTHQQRAAITTFAGLEKVAPQEMTAPAGDEGVWVRRPAHLKLSFRPGAEVAAKVYLSLKRGWLGQPEHQ